MPVGLYTALELNGTVIVVKIVDVRVLVISTVVVISLPFGFVYVVGTATTLVMQVVVFFVITSGACELGYGAPLDTPTGSKVLALAGDSLG